MRVTVTAPATTANLGPGFDCLGAALDWHVRVTVDTDSSGWTYDGPADPPPDDGLVRRALSTVSPEHGDVGLTCDTTVASGAGLGSSASAIACGLVAGCALSGRDPDPGDLLGLGLPLEGHPDNLAPALYGGVTIATPAGVVRLDPPDAVTPAILVSAAALPTDQARKALPATVPHADAVSNVGLVAGLVAVLAGSGDARALTQLTADRLHQPYRARLMPATADAVARLRERGIAAFVSGAGPSVGCLLTADTLDAFDAVAPALDGFEIVRPGWDARGARVAS